MGASDRFLVDREWHGFLGGGLVGLFVLAWFWGAMPWVCLDWLAGKQNQLMGEEEGILHLLPSVCKEQENSFSERQKHILFSLFKAILHFYSLFNTPDDTVYIDNAQF